MTEEGIKMGKKQFKLWLLILCAVIALGAFTGCKKKKKETKATSAPTTETTAKVTEDTKETEDTAPSSETTEESKESETTTESTTEATTKATTTEATTEATTTSETEKETSKEPENLIDEDGEYNSKDDVALYIYTYGHLPKNYVTKNEAREKGWEGGSLEDYFPGCSIGGDSFGNREGNLPTKKGRKYTECDIDTKGKKSRGAKRIVFSNDGLIYYTEDHYETFELLYGEE